MIVIYQPANFITSLLLHLWPCIRYHSVYVLLVQLKMPWLILQLSASLVLPSHANPLHCFCECQSQGAFQWQNCSLYMLTWQLGNPVLWGCTPEDNILLQKLHDQDEFDGVAHWLGREYLKSIVICMQRSGDSCNCPANEKYISVPWQHSHTTS